MDSTTRSRSYQVVQTAPGAIRWRTWLLVDRPRSSWPIVGIVLLIAVLVAYVGGSWLISLAATVGLVATLWQLFVPVGYELDALGVRRFALGRSRLFPWHVVRAYELRPTGVVLYQRHEPARVDLLRSIFVPYPRDEDEMLCAVREHLSHAVEVSR